MSFGSNTQNILFIPPNFKNLILLFYNFYFNSFINNKIVYKVTDYQLNHQLNTVIKLVLLFNYSL